MSAKSSFLPYTYAYFENEIVPVERAKVSIMTNALHYGVGIFGGIKGIDTKFGSSIFRLDDHIKRLDKSIKTLKLPYDLSANDFKKNVIELSRKNNIAGDTYIRPIIYRSDLNLSPDIQGEYSLAIYMLKMSGYFDADKGLSVCISRWVRNNENSIPPQTKATGGYINSALAIDEAHSLGFDSAIMLDKEGNVSEGAVMNIFLVIDNQLITPSLDSDILEGITRKTILELAKQQGIETIERKVKKEELFSADEVFFTGTAAGVTWCREINNIKISKNPGTLTSKMVKVFSGLSISHPKLFTKI